MTHYPLVLTQPSSPYGVYRNNYGTNNTNSVFSFAGSDIGDPSPDRVIALVVSYFKFDTSTIITSLTVGGTSLTERVTRSRVISGASGSLIYTAIWSAVIPNNSTATINIGFNNSIERGCQIGVWSIYNAQTTTPNSTTSGTGGPTTAVSLSANVQPNDFGIVGATNAYGTGTAAFSYANATERYDTRSTGAGVQDIARSGADFVALEADAARTVTITPSGISDGGTYVMATWR